MSKVVIIGNGEFPKKEFPRSVVASADRIICCDGAFATWLRVAPKLFPEGLRLPDVVIGDMDSLSARLREKYAGIMVHLTEQEENDQTKAFRYVMANYPDAEEIHFIGSTGKREDHTVGNMSLLMEYARQFGTDGLGTDGRPVVDMISDNGVIFAVTDTCSIMVGEGRRISLFCPDSTVQIKSEGLVWPTDNVVFDIWWKATLNRSCADEIRLTFSHKSIALLMLD